VVVASEIMQRLLFWCFDFLVCFDLGFVLFCFFFFFFFFDPYLFDI
jgi:hypothetical protein